MNRLWFLTAAAGNFFMTELLAGLAGAAERSGVEVGFAADSYPDYEPGDAYVVIPHEFFVCAERATLATPEQLASTVAVCVEQPGTQWFDLAASYAAGVGATVGIHVSACTELAKRGIPAGHLALGYAPEWDLWHGEAGHRPIDVLYLGSQDPRRDRILSGLADSLYWRATRFLIPSEGPKPGPRPTFLTGADKYRQLLESKLLLNVHRSAAAGLIEWMRVLEAICNGCVVVSEHSADHLPLVPGEHFLSGRPEDLALLAHGLLDNPHRAAQIQLSAYDLIRTELTMDAGIVALLDAGETAVGRSRGGSGAGTQPPFSLPTPQAPPPPDPVLEQVGRELAPLRSALKSLTLDALASRRRLEAIERGVVGAFVTVVAETDTYPVCEPLISVLIPLHNYEREVVEALRSVACSTHPAYEVLVLDDSSTDGSRPAVQRFLREYAWLPARLLANASNRGLGATRNALIEHARGEVLFMLDADNAIFPTTLTVLEHALDADRTASFAYGMSAVEEDGGGVGLVSVGHWDPERLTLNNYIDAMAMIRRAALVELGGYTEDIRLTGWEDFDLWLRMAARGMHPVQVPEIVARYRRRAHSMLSSITNIDATTAWSLVRTRSPEVFNPPPGRQAEVRQCISGSGHAHMEMWLDEPANETAVRREHTLVVSGWAASTTDIAHVTVEVGGERFQPIRGLPRADVARRHPLLKDVEWSGFRLVLSANELPVGLHEVTVVAEDADGRGVRRRAAVEIASSALVSETRPTSLAPAPSADPRLEVWILARGASADQVARTKAAIERQTLAPCAVQLISATDGTLDAALHRVAPSAEYVATVRAGDEPVAEALARILSAAEEGKPDLIYGDDAINADGSIELFHKPGWSPELQANLDYVGPFAAIRTERLGRAVARRPTAAGGGELIRALLDTHGLTGRRIPEVLATRAERPVPDPERPSATGLARAPLVSVVIPTAAHGEHLARCLRSIAGRSTYERLELVIVDSSDDGLPDVASLAAPLPVRVTRYSGPFNYSSAINQGAVCARGEYLLLLNDDVEVMTPDWIERLLDQALRPGVGVVGCKLVRTDGTIQHAGVLVHSGSAEHLFDYFPDDDAHFGMLQTTRNCSAVTGACLMISSGLYRWLGGLDDAFVLDYGDTDLCLRVVEQGQRVAWTPHAVLRHDERSSRGADSPSADLQTFRKHWGAWMERGDPLYNPNLAAMPQFEPARNVAVPSRT